MADALTEELLELNDRLLRCIAEADWDTYRELCDPTLTAFEPEAQGQLIEGLAFHRFYFDLAGVKGPHQTTMAAPRVRLLGDVGLVTYVRLVQRVGTDGAPRTQAFEETRLWQRSDGRWRHIHFHRSALGKASS